MNTPVVEVAIGLVFMFFLLATIASAFVEFGAAIFSTRSAHLEEAVRRLILDATTGKSAGGSGTTDGGTESAGQPPGTGSGEPGTATSDAVQQLANTSTISALMVPKRGGKDPRWPSYLPAHAFADGVVEYVGTVVRAGGDAAADFKKLPPGLQARLKPLLHEAGSDLDRLKAGLERWFDDAMGRLSGIYKRRSMLILFVLGCGLAVGLNASAIRVAETLWTDPVTRAAVADYAGSTFGTTTTKPGTTSPTTTPGDLTNRVKDFREKVADSLLPIGWKNESNPHGTSGWLLAILGWLITGAMISLGAPFWFGLLTRLTSLRATGTKPPPAPDDPSSATAKVTAKATATTADPLAPPPSALATRLATVVTPRPSSDPGENSTPT